MTLWAILPAAGIGRRMGSMLPKQYLPLNGVPVLVHTLRKLLSVDAIRKLVVVLHPADSTWETLGLQDARLSTVTGGDERFQSVLNGLQSLENEAKEDDWVLVHDAVRPCVDVNDITRLITRLASHDVGGLLGIPVTDTLKRVDSESVVQETVDRSEFWQAQTPQMFRYGMLMRALQQVLASAITVTDEAAAIEQLGLHPQLVAGHKDNIKITHEADLARAAAILQSQYANREEK